MSLHTVAGIPVHLTPSDQKRLRDQVSTDTCEELVTWLSSTPGTEDHGEYYWTSLTSLADPSKKCQDAAKSRLLSMREREETIHLHLGRV